jgi:hypothetical protein
VSRSVPLAKAQTRRDDSTLGSVDPEEFHEVISAYQKSVAETVQRFGEKGIDSCSQQT